MARRRLTNGPAGGWPGELLLRNAFQFVGRQRCIADVMGKPQQCLLLIPLRAGIRVVEIQPRRPGHVLHVARAFDEARHRIEAERAS